MTLWTGFKQQNFASKETIGPNEEALQTVRHGLNIYASTCAFLAFLTRGWTPQTRYTI